MSQLELCVVSDSVTSVDNSQAQLREIFKFRTIAILNVLFSSINAMTLESYDRTNIGINTELVGNTKSICQNGFRDACKNTPIASSELPQ
jgi:hypothetical protein